MSTGNTVQIIGAVIDVAFERTGVIGAFSSPVQVAAHDVYRVRDPDDRTAPGVSLDSLSNGDILREPIDILGTIDDANLDSWLNQVQVEIRVCRLFPLDRTKEQAFIVTCSDPCGGNENPEAMGVFIKRVAFRISG